MPSQTNFIKFRNVFFEIYIFCYRLPWTCTLVKCLILLNPIITKLLSLAQQTHHVLTGPKLGKTNNVWSSINALFVSRKISQKNGISISNHSLLLFFHTGLDCEFSFFFFFVIFKKGDIHNINYIKSFTRLLIRKVFSRTGDGVKFSTHTNTHSILFPLATFSDKKYLPETELHL